MKIYIDQFGLFKNVQEDHFNATMKVARDEYKEGMVSAQFYVTNKKRVHKFIPILFAKAIHKHY